MLNELAIKRLKRAGVEPARVFGRRDFDAKSVAPLWHYRWAGHDYYSPNYPQWMVLDDGDSPVLDKAIQRYGVEEAPSGWVRMAERLLDWDLQHALVVDDVHYNDYERSDGLIFTGYALRGGIAPATPMMYAERRWSDRLVWTYSTGSPYLRAVSLDSEACLVVIRVMDPETVEFIPSSEAA